jgi:hypothetical protein
VNSPLPLSPLAGEAGKSGAGLAQVPWELNLMLITVLKPFSHWLPGFSGSQVPLQKGHLLPADIQNKIYIQSELPFKEKTLHEKTSLFYQGLL